MSGQKTNWGTLNNVNIEKYEVSDNTKYETEVLGYEGGGSIAVFVNFDKINNVEGYGVTIITTVKKFLLKISIVATSVYFLMHRNFRIKQKSELIKRLTEKACMAHT